MAIIVETGEGLETSDSYISVATCDDYHTKYGNASWTGTTDQKEIALRKATRYLDLKYGQRWFGQRTNENQALDWPRSGVVDRDGYGLDDDEMPKDLTFATAEAALVCLTEDPLADVEPEDSGSLASERVKVGPIEIDETYLGGKSSSKRYKKVESFVDSLVCAPGQLDRG